MKMSYAELFEVFREMQGGKARRKTFMDVSGYPHYENVVSNILAFLFDDSEEHGMRNLWMNALLSCSVDQEKYRATRNIRVEREVYTEKGNRIDLLISTDDYVVCIENKIFSGVGNDLADYKKTAKKRFEAEEKELVCVLLSLTPAVYQEKEMFRNVLYKDLFSAVRAEIGSYMESCSNTWLVYVKDFIATIETLSGGSMINGEFETLYKEYFCDIRHLDKIRKEYLDSVKSEAQKLREILQIGWDEFCRKIAYPHNIKFWDSVYTARDELRSSVVIDFDLDQNGGNCVAVETSRDAWGWHIALHKRKGRKNSAFDRLFAKGIPHPARVLPEGAAELSDDEFYTGQNIVKNLPAGIPLEMAAEIICETIEELLPAFQSCME